MTKHVELRWRPTRTMHTLATIALVGLVLAAGLRSGVALALVVPELLWLAAFGRPRLPRTTRVLADCSSSYGEEGDELSADLVVSMSGPPVQVEARCHGAPDPPSEFADSGPDRSWTWVVPAGRWGRAPLCRGRVTFSSRSGLWVAHVDVDWPVVTVLPGRVALRETVRSPRVRDWAGSRPARVNGPGIEATGATPFVRGMPFRHVNWRQTMRHGELHVTTFAAERAQDVVLVVDVTVETGPAGDTTVDRAVRAAAALARSHVEAGDRVGLVTISPAIGWTVPGLGRRHLVRLLERLITLRDRESVVPPDLDRIPRSAVPPGSLVILLSPLLSEESVGIAGDLRRRGHPELLVDVLSGEPPFTGDEDLARVAHRLWWLDRIATRMALEDRGVRVVTWSPGTSLVAALAAALKGPVAAHGEVVA